VATGQGCMIPSLMQEIFTPAHQCRWSADAGLLPDSPLTPSPCPARSRCVLAGQFGSSRSGRNPNRYFVRCQQEVQAVPEARRRDGRVENARPPSALAATPAGTGSPASAGEDEKNPVMRDCHAGIRGSPG